MKTPKETTDQPRTPLMKQYWEIKSLHPDKILFFRMGDFYELFFEDAKTAAPLLGIQLTSRNKKALDETPMCGLPHHAIATPLNKLLALGFKIALCDQVEDPKFAKGLVKRAVTRILGPGMVYDPATLDEASPLYIAAFLKTQLALVDTSTEESFYLEDISRDELLELHKLLGFVELICHEDDENFVRSLEFEKAVHLSFRTSHENFTAREMIQDYIQSYRPTEEMRAFQFQKRSWRGRMEMSALSYEHLEVFHSDHGQSFFDCIRRTVSPLGARRLKYFLRFPLRDTAAIERRQAQVAEWISKSETLFEVRKVLASIGDLERRFTKVTLAQCSGRDVRALSESVQSALLALRFVGLLPRETFHDLADLADRAEKILQDDQPISIKQGGLIRSGYSRELDELIQLATHGEERLLELEQKMRQETKIPSLKIRYHNIFGYSFEITKIHNEKIPTNFVRKQTLVNAERYTHADLIELEQKILHAQTHRNDMEYEIFVALRAEWIKKIPLLTDLAEVVADLDVTTSFAFFALENRCVAPVFVTDESGFLEIEHSRHPVVEAQIKSRFVTNSIRVRRGETILLTGPNMAGKSTLMRQVALTILVAQIGCYVPATSAKLSLVDQIFTRIGAHDKLSAGLSTFMVEMTETADIVHGYTKNSLILLDEIGRGTSTYDGLSLAQALLENFLKTGNGYIFFATHYHELTRLEKVYPALKNFHMAVREQDGHLDFSYVLKRGAAQKSYGIQVAKLAGMPPGIVKRAGDILKTLESSALSSREQLDLFEI